MEGPAVAVGLGDPARKSVGYADVRVVGASVLENVSGSLQLQE